MAWHRLFEPSIPLANLSLKQQGDKTLRNRDKVSVLDLDKTVFVKLKNSKKEFSAVERDQQISALQKRLDEISMYKEKLEKKPSDMVDLKQYVQTIRSKLMIDKELNTREEALDAFDMLKVSIENLKFNLEKIDLTAIDLQTRCEQLMKVIPPHGFHFKIQEPIISASAKDVTYKFEGKSQLEQSKSACLSISKKQAWSQEVGIVGFAYGGIGTAVEEYQKNRTTEMNNDVSKTSMLRSNIAIATAKAIQEIAVFNCESITLDNDAINMARKIGKATTQKEKEIRALEFLNVYPAEINMGPFGIGGWYEYTATTTSSKTRRRQTLQQEAASQATSKLILAAKGISIVGTVQAGLSKGDEVKAGSGIADMKNIKNGTMTSTFEYNCAGPTVYTMYDLITNLKDPNNWSIFPSINNRNPKFKRVYDIIASLAAELNDDEELSNAAILLKQIINKGPKTAFQDEYLAAKQYFFFLQQLL